MPQFEINNKAAEKWTEQECLNTFELMLFNAKEDDEILSMYDAYSSVELRGSTMHYLINKFPVLEKFKNDIQDCIASRINKEALKNKFNPTASIWRMKQLGERDDKHIDHTTGGDKFEPPIIKFK